LSFVALISQLLLLLLFLIQRNIFINLCIWEGIVNIKPPVNPRISPKNSKVDGIFIHLIASINVNKIVYEVIRAKAGPTGPLETECMWQPIPNVLNALPRRPAAKSCESSLFVWKWKIIKIVKTNATIVKLPIEVLNESKFLSVIKCLASKQLNVNAIVVISPIITGTHEAICSSI